MNISKIYIFCFKLNIMTNDKTTFDEIKLKQK